MSPNRKPVAPEVGPGTQIGPYRVTAKLGTGGFGTVFLAEHAGELSALKLLALRDVGEWAEREVVVLARVKHPNVARLRGFWQWPEEAPCYHVVVMEYVPGLRLDEWTGTENPSARRVLRLLLGMARGLAEAHRCKVVHRDVKEANVIIREPDGEAVLVDFGVSGCEDASRITGGMMPPGTVEYRSPEAWRFRQENKANTEARYRPQPADDVYALGVVLYWLLTDTLPFSESEGPGLEELLTRSPVAPHVRNARVPQELSGLCLRLLETQPESRPDAEAVCRAVEELLTRQEAPEWEAPLCEDFSGHNLSTVPGEQVDDEAQWVNQMRQAVARPRRGKRLPRGEASLPGAPEWVPASPAQHAPEVLPAPLPSVLVPVRVPERSMKVQLPKPARGRMVALGILAIALGTAGLLTRLMASSPQAQPAAHRRGEESPQVGAQLPTWEGGWKVAPPLKPLEASRSGPLGLAGVALEKDDASVTIPKQKQKKLGALKKALTTVGTCAVLGCTGTQVLRADPGPTPCPPGAAEAMEEHGLYVDAPANDLLFGKENEWLALSEGWVTVKEPGRWGKVRGGSTFSGQLTFGEKRAFLRLTQAQTKDGTFPVCIEGYDLGGGLGLERREDGKIFSEVLLRAVDHFR